MIKKLFFLLVFFIYFPCVYAATESAIFGMGCFWCAQSDFDKLPGVVSTTVGYDGGKTPNPTYEEVSSGTTNYAEVVKVEFNPKKVTYLQVLDYFWHHIDPTVMDQQFCDHGHQYRSSIFYLNDKQKKDAHTSIAQVKRQIPQIYTEIVPSTTFYKAEDYHQDYYKKNPTRYSFYRWNCGRDARVKEVWNAVK